MFFSDNAKWKQEENGSSPHTHCICSSCILNTRAQTELIELSIKYIIMLRTLPQFAFQSTYYTEQNLYPSPLVRPCQGGPISPVWILKHLVLVFINACRLLSALPSLSQFGRGRLSLVTISFYPLLLLFGPCRLSEFTLAGPHWFDWDQVGGWFTGIFKKNNKEHTIDVQFVSHLPMIKLRQKNNGQSNNVHCCTIYI